MHLLFVCTGNICRSPTAERLTTAFAQRHSLGGLFASSAGTRAVIASPMHPDAASVLQALGGDPSSFAARQLSKRLLAGVDFVITMEREHRDAVLGYEPRMMRRTFTLLEASYLSSRLDVSSIEELVRHRPLLSGVPYADIPDPIGMPTEVFDRVGAQIAAGIETVLQVFKDSVT